MCDCLPKMLCVYCIYIYIYHVNKFEARLLFLYLPLKNCNANTMHYGHEFGLHLTRGVHATLPPCPPQPPANSPPPLRSPADRYHTALVTDRALLPAR